MVAAQSYFLYGVVLLLKSDNWLRLSAVGSDALNLAPTAKLTVSPSTKEVKASIFCGDNTSMSSSAAYLLNFTFKVKLSRLVQVLLILVS